MKTTLIARLKAHLDSISQAQFAEEWSKIEKQGFGGPTVDEYLCQELEPPGWSFIISENITSKKFFEVFFA